MTGGYDVQADPLRRVFGAPAWTYGAMYLGPRVFFLFVFGLSYAKLAWRLVLLAWFGGKFRPWPL